MAVQRTFSSHCDKRIFFPQLFSFDRIGIDVLITDIASPFLLIICALLVSPFPRPEFFQLLGTS